MSKTNRIYKIFMTTMIVAIAGMLLAMGIIAAQKTMKLGVQFSSNPNYKLAIAINNEENVVFQNFDNVIMDNGISSLNGNVLVADDEVFKDYGNDFTIIIKNYTESTGIEVSMTSTAKIDGGADGIPAQIENEDNTASKYSSGDPDSVSFRVYVNSVFPQITTLKMTISELSGYTIVFHKNDGSGTDTTISQVVGANQSYTMPSDLFENGVHEFVEWNLLANGSSQTKYQSGATVQGLAQAGATIDLYAQWTHTVTFEITYEVALYESGMGDIFDHGCGLAIMMTNDDKFKYYGGNYFDSSSAESHKSALYYQRDGSTPTILNPNRASSTPIKNKFLSTGFGYREYYSEYTEDYVSSKIKYSTQCPSGYNIFIGNYGEEMKLFYSWGCTSCTITPNRTFSMYDNYDNLVSTFGEVNNVQYIKTTMPNENLKIEVTTSYIFYGGSN